MLKGVFKGGTTTALSVFFSKLCMKKTEVGRPQIHSRTQNIVAINQEKQTIFFFFCVYDKENMGIILVRTATLLLVATYTPEMSPSICVEAVEKLGKLHNIAIDNTVY